MTNGNTNGNGKHPPEGGTLKGDSFPATCANAALRIASLIVQLKALESQFERASVCVRGVSGIGRPLVVSDVCRLLRRTGDAHHESARILEQYEGLV